MAALRSMLSLVSPGGARGRLSILIFHRVLAVPDPLFPGEVDAAAFDSICGWVAALFNVLPLDEAVDRLHRRDLPARALAITFDDGYADNHDIALPILQRHGLTATFYIATGFLDGGRMWNDSVIEAIRRCTQPMLDTTPLGIDGLGELPMGTTGERRAAIDALLGRIKYRPVAERLQLVSLLAQFSGAKMPDNLMMRSEEVRAMHAAGMQIGAHTVSHPILATLDANAARQEIVQSRERLEALIGAPVRSFAYPNGVPGKDYTAESVSLVKELGFDSAVTTGWGAARGDTDLRQLPRFSPWDRTHARFALRMMRNLWAS